MPTITSSRPEPAGVQPYIPDFISSQTPPDSGQAPVCDQGSFRKTFVTEAPLFCECARIGRRALSWLTWIPGLSANPVLDTLNAEVAHEHISFEWSKDDVGYGPEGLFREKADSGDYRFEPECYDGELMRQAIAEAEPPRPYLFFFNNCQSYIDRVLQRYRALVSKSWRDSKPNDS
jgi:hypothetical protein